MPFVGVLHPEPGLKASLRKSLSGGWLVMRSVRSAGGLARLLERELVDALFLDADLKHGTLPEALLRSFPGVPVLLSGRFRPDDGEFLARAVRAGVDTLLVRGVDDFAMADLLAARSATRRRLAQLHDAPDLLRLSEPIQLKAWQVAMLRAGVKTTTADLARALSVSREHLSREFAAGGAPNLKRVIDLAKVVCAADLLANPGYNVKGVAAILRFASPSHLAEAARRVAGVKPTGLAALGPRGVLGRFLKGRTRSRF